jgi:hypothetical protein
LEPEVKQKIEKELKDLKESRSRNGRPPLRAASIKTSPKSNDVSMMSKSSAKKAAVKNPATPKTK